MRTSLYVDLSNIHYQAKKLIGREVDYQKIKDWVQGLGNIVDFRVYGADSQNKSDEAFKKFLIHIGAVCNFKHPKTFINPDGVSRTKGNCDVDLCVDVMDNVTPDKTDMLVLLSSDGDFVPMVNAILKRGIKVLILGINISNSLRAITECVEIPESLFRDIKW